MNFMRLKRYFFIVVMAVLCLSGCSGIKKVRDIKVNGVKIESIIPNGLKGATLNVAVEVDNPAPAISLSDISGTLEHSGKILGRVDVDPFSIQAEKADTYHLKANVTLGEGTSIFDLGRLVNKTVIEESVVDLSARIKIRNGAARKVKLDDVPLKKLLETVKK